MSEMAEDPLLASAFAFASEVLTPEELEAICQKYILPLEVIGKVVMRKDDFFICSIPEGDVFVPHSISESQTHSASSWILTVIPSERRRTQWQALSAKPNTDGWENAQRRAPFKSKKHLGTKPSRR